MDLLLEAILYTFLCIVILFGVAVYHAVQTHKAFKHVNVKELQSLNVPRESLFRIFQPHLIAMNEIASRGYSSVFSLVQVLIGVVPTCDMVLEIWKPAFECYNIIVPNFLNLPEMLLPGYDIRELVSLSNYVSSRANMCAYCTSHCCSFAMRRGVVPEKLRDALDALLKEGGGDTMFTPRERAVIRVSYGLGSVPSCLTKEDTDMLESTLASPDQVEWIVASCAMFGSFNKYMDGLGIPLENDTYFETMDYMDSKFVTSMSKNPASAGFTNTNSNNNNNVGSKNGSKATALPVPPKDDWKRLLAVIYHGLRPGGALALDKKLLKGVPTTAEESIVFLKKLCGATFPVLANLHHTRFRRALTAVLSKNFVTDGISLHTKVLAGIQYCEILQNKQLQCELEEILALYKSKNNIKDTENPNRHVVLMKDSLEKIKEQLLNIL